MGQVFRIPLTVSPQASILAAIMVLTIPIKWIVAWFIAALWHESFHILALYFSGNHIRSVCVGAFGAQIRTDPLPPGEAILCALAGPISGFLLLLISSIFPRFAICGFLQSVFNLLPVYPLDGSVAVDGFLRIFCLQDRAEKIEQIVESIVLVLLISLLLISAFIWNLGAGPVVFALFFILRMKRRKIPCKWNA